MFYCNSCREKNKWPETFSKSHGACECCGVIAACNDLPSRLLPPKERENEKIAMDAVEHLGQQTEI